MSEYINKLSSIAVKKQKLIEEEKKLKELQEHCSHVYKHNGLFHYYCPICRKKLTKAKPPLTPLQGTIVRT